MTQNQQTTNGLIKPGLNIIIDGQWGSTGKGKLCGYLGAQGPAYCCSSFGPNAGHTFIDDDGTKVVFKVMPSSCLKAPEATVLILPDSVIQIDRFMEEVKMIKNKVLVHPLVAVVTPEHKTADEANARHIASTMQGTGPAIANKLLRIKGVKLAKDLLPQEYIADTSALIREACFKGQPVIVEVSQGFDLSLNHGTSYPYVTSRDVTVGCAINACGCSHRYIGQVIGSIRLHPIRVGNVEAVDGKESGFSGPWHQDQKETSWGEIAQLSGGPSDLTETTTVTKRTRRVFTFSMEQIVNFCHVNSPDWLFLNFVQYDNWAMNGTTDWSVISDNVKKLIMEIYNATGVPVVFVGTGAKQSEMIAVPWQVQRITSIAK